MLCQRRRRLLTLLFTFFIYKTAKSQIPIGSKLSILENDYWISPNGNFAIGFFNRTDPNQYSVGIRFNSKSIPIDNQAVVWVAGANLVVGEKSYFEFRENGEFVLFDSIRDSIAWASSYNVVNSNTNITKQSAATAALLDDGNLVIVSNGNKIIWQSFNDPSDTLLPGQNLSVSNILRADSGNLLSSYYSLRLNDFESGKLQLRWERSTVYWENFDSGSDSVISRAVLDFNGRFQVVDNQSRAVWSVYASDHNDSSIEFRFLRLDIDGNLRLYSWFNTEKRWRTVWQAVSDQCDVFATCGLNGICAFAFNSSSPVCRCLFTTSDKTSEKCLDCKYGSLTTRYKHTSLYGIYPPNETIVLANENQCEELCNNDAMCTAATFLNPTCRLLKTQYVSGKTYPSLNSVSFVKKCNNDPLAVKPESPTTMKSSSSSVSKEVYIAYLVGLPSCVLVLLVAVQIGIAFFIWKRNNRLITKRVATKGLMMIFSYSEIIDITENFNNQIGPRMFKGKLNKKLVAVKDVKSDDIEERKFRTVMSRIGNIHHKNLVKVEGYCYELGHRFVVYEFANRGSLKDFMDDDYKLSWRKRIEICLAIAKAVSYLHSGCREYIGHGNLKIENVVLDENLEAKVSEFGVHVVSEKTDVEDFGVMLLRLISGRRKEFAGDGFLAAWAYEKWEEERAVEIVDERIIEGGFDFGELERLLRIAFWCLQEDERFRSSMSEVVKVLEGNLTVDLPPRPVPCISG